MITMKNKYQRLSKEEKLEARKLYISRNPNTYKKFKKLSRLTIVGMIYAVFVIVFDIFFHKSLFKESFISNIILDSCVLVFCLIFYIFSKTTINSQINKMLVEDLRNKQIEKWRKEEQEEFSKSKKNSKKKISKTTTKKTTKKSSKK